MDEERIKQIIKQELAHLLRKDRYTFSKLIQILDGRNIQTGLTTGTKIGTATTQKVGFFNTTPVVQPTKTQDPTGQTADKDNEARQAISNIIDKLQSIGLMST